MAIPAWLTADRVFFVLLLFGASIFVSVMVMKLQSQTDEHAEEVSKELATLRAQQRRLTGNIDTVSTASVHLFDTLHAMTASGQQLPPSQQQQQQQAAQPLTGMASARPIVDTMPQPPPSQFLPPQQQQQQLPVMSPLQQLPPLPPLAAGGGYDAVGGGYSREMQGLGMFGGRDHPFGMGLAPRPGEMLPQRPGGGGGVMMMPSQQQGGGGGGMPFGGNAQGPTSNVGAGMRIGIAGSSGGVSGGGVITSAPMATGGGGGGMGMGGGFGMGSQGMGGGRGNRDSVPMPMQTRQQIPESVGMHAGSTMMYPR